MNCLQEMNIGNKIYLKDIEHIADDSHIKLRVLKIWNFIKNNQVLSTEMIIMNEEAGDSLHLFPNQMNVLKNRKFAFLVDSTPYNVTNYNIYITVKLTEDVSIVSELESKLELMSVQSVFLNEVSLQSDDVVQNVENDVISQTDESFTPSTVDKSSATSPMKISGGLKRDLHDIYDGGGFDFSSTKSKRKSMGEGNSLLVPKVEK
ncbi:unnamed protein product [Lactuca saligna]|uniref:DUF223 domain-containing protein n=1 Tax=Lactuca saligna TaxID=75948 RepID=A0AA35VP49_LACSI|nr:unnamed protein product [Lactuca saligna]